MPPTSRSAARGSATSAWAATDRGPSFRTASTVESAASFPRLYWTPTSAPSLASSRTAARPMPPLPPVTRATRPSRRPTPTRPARRVINPRTVEGSANGDGRGRRTKYPPRASGAASMGRSVHVSTEFAFLLSGVFIMLVAWALNLLGTIAGDQSSGHGVSDVYLWLFLTGFLIAAFVVTRTVAFWPIGVVEDVDPLGIISKAVEVATGAVLISLIRANHAKKHQTRAASAVNGP